jgi:hypothetical protein
MILFTLGLVVGCTIGTFVAGLCVASSRGNRDDI